MLLTYQNRHAILKTASVTLFKAAGSRSQEVFRMNTESVRRVCFSRPIRLSG